jgi:DNA-binding beta-propeller fold protein YncE
MKREALKLAVISIALLATGLVSNRIGLLQGQIKKVPGDGFAAVPGQKGGEDVFGPYDPVSNWPKPLAESLPELKGWTYSQATYVFPETPDRVFVAQKGLLPELPKNLKTKWLPEIGPGIKFPVGMGLPLRETASATPSCGGMQNPPGMPRNPNCPDVSDGHEGRPGVDWRWDHVIVVVDRNGNVVEDWTQWDKIWGRPHDIEVSPYDPDKAVWIVDADNHFVSKFTHDGKQRILTLGTPGVPGTDDTHFARPTFMAFEPDGSFYLCDGYDGTRVIKYDKNGKKLFQWGEKGTPPNEKRPGYFSSVHGIAIDPERHFVFINDRNDGRVQKFDENGKFLDQWDMGPRPPMNIHSIYMGQNHILWAADQGSNKLNAYDEDGHYLYSWGTFGTCQGCMWGVHGFVTDTEGTLYTAEVRTGRVQKYTPRKGASPDFLVGKPWGLVQRTQAAR